uniref:Uncharacterized protein n=2 Tax=Plectus sambesii TaxID=2011161 RepID=A0A914VF73_9BILA
MRSLILSLLLCLCVTIQPSEQKIEQANDGSSGTISMSPPNLNDEETESVHMPSYLKCDACQIIANLFIKGFANAEKKFKDDKMLTESEVINVVDSVCNSQFEGYGITEIEGRKRLKGPDFNFDVPGISQSGGKWPFRFHQICLEYPGAVSEWIIYVWYRKHEARYNDTQKQLFVKWMCEEAEEVAYCAPKKKKKASKKKEL